MLSSWFVTITRKKAKLDRFLNIVQGLINRFSIAVTALNHGTAHHEMAIGILFNQYWKILFCGHNGYVFASPFEKGELRGIYLKKSPLTTLLQRGELKITKAMLWPENKEVRRA